MLAPAQRRLLPQRCDIEAVEQTIFLTGDRHANSEAVGDVVRRIPRALRYATRMAFEGRSTSGRGRDPAWLESAASVEFIEGKRQSDGVRLRFAVPTLGDAAQQVYAQHELWGSRPDPADTGFDLLADVVRDLAAHDANSERYDHPLLNRIGRFNDAIDINSFMSLEISTRREVAGAPASITPEVIATAKAFTASTPASRAVRVYGRLDMLRDSTQTFSLKLADGSDARGVVDGFDVRTLAGLLRSDVLVLGRAIYRPSRRLLRIDASSVQAAGSGDDQRLFSKVPTPMQRGLNGARTAVIQSRRGNGIAAIFGRWPGDETEEQITATLKEMG